MLVAGHYKDRMNMRWHVHCKEVKMEHPKIHAGSLKNVRTSKLFQMGCTGDASSLAPFFFTASLFTASKYLAGKTGNMRIIYLVAVIQFSRKEVSAIITSIVFHTL